MRINVDTELEKIDYEIKKLKNTGRQLKEDLENSKNKEDIENLKYRILIVIYSIKQQEDRKKLLLGLKERMNTTSVSKKLNNDMGNKLIRLKEVLKIYQENSSSIERMLKYGKIDNLKEEYNFDSDDIKFINYLIDNYKNIHVNFKKR